MKKIQLSMIFILGLGASFNLISQDQKIPVIDRDLFFGNPEISGGQLSPDGEWISFMKEYNGIMNIWVKKLDEPFDKARPLTDSPRPLYGYFWTYDGKYILYVKDKDGDENMNVFAVDPRAGATDGNLPESRNLTPLEEVTAQIYKVSRSDPDMLMIGLNDRDKAWHDLYTLKISTAELTKIYENNDRITGYNFDWDDNLRLLNQTDNKGNTTIFRIDEGNQLTPIYEFSVHEQAYAAGWNEDNTKIYFVSNKGDLDLSTLFLMDPETKELTKIESDPNDKVDFGNLNMDQNTRKLISTSYTDDKTRIYWKNEKWQQNYNFLLKEFPGREISFQSSTKDYSKLLISVWGGKYASDTYLFDVSTKNKIHQYTPRPALKKVEKYLSEMKPITYNSSDGLEIPAYLTVPSGKQMKDLPLVVLVHGGPKGPRDYWGFNATAQFLTNRGYAVLQPNFRASGGYGKSFLNAGDLQWGKLMQDDITWGVKYLVKEGIADKNKVAIMGGSYGGYATLAGLAFTPDVYACGVDIVGPSNIFTLLESIPPYWEAGRAFLYGMVGNPDTEEGKKLIKEASPLFFADKMDKPLLIIQGANDPRVKKAEADQIVIALRENGKQVNYLLADDEGHGFAKPVNRMAMFAEIESFLASILEGVHQKEMPEEVSDRLKELTVDIDKVTYEPKREEITAENLPEISDLLKPQTLSYDISLEMQGQQVPMTMIRTVIQKEGHWLIKEETKGAMGEASDEMEYTAELVPVSRNVNQMGQTMSMSFNQKKISIAAMGQNIDMVMNGAYLSDGPGIDHLIAGMPLETGFELIFEIPEVMTMKPKQVVLSVEDKEEVNGVKCWKVTITSTNNPSDMTTLWINPDAQCAEKTVKIIPAMGNAKMTIVKK